ncbi:GNAT family N-acetyltransferase [Bacillus alkalicellulosilyticus]|uniref:GNAT family N-acetyltransferase n=1 Tax=Alkalihalobacterium alkalicellulosilyticum TaxID=1912214 RepID=UPI00099829EA|nr:GNAT family N-acetyltransferase [Bacillus alkalicellulosilyticus]
MDKTKLLEQLVDMEQQYVRLFSDAIETDEAITFSDCAIPDMYSHNFSWYKSSEGLHDFICKSLKKKETIASGFFRVETTTPIRKEFLDRLPVQPQVCTYDIMFFETKQYHSLKGNPVCTIKKATDETVLEDGIDVDIVANQEEMGLDFATRRINRKAEVYKSNKMLDMFVCYKGKTPIGNIEYMSREGIVKLDDFSILEQYQRKGFGTAVLKYVLEQAYTTNNEIAYLITDNEDTAKEMYEKNGFSKIGVKTELLFFL